MRIRIYNALILTMETKNDMNADDCWEKFALKPYFHGEIYIENDRISKIINCDELNDMCSNHDAGTFDRQINANGNLIMPGFKNAHAHSPMTFARSIADDLPLQQWLDEKIFPMEAKLTPDIIRVFSKISIMEYLTSGITASFDMYFKPENIAAAANSCGFRLVICGAVNDFVESIERMNDLYNFYNSKSTLISYQLGFHAEYTTNEKLLREISELAAKKKAPVYCHCCETKGEVAGCISRHATTPFAYLDSLGMFLHGGGGFHMIYTSNEDLAVIKNHNLHIVTNPASNAKLASGIAPLYKYMDCGLNIAIGTDGAASNNALDMFREMYLTTALAKLLTENASSMAADKVLYMATVGGAKAMHLDECDILAAGKKADLIMINLDTPNMQPINNITKNVVLAGSRSNVIMTMINGNILYENNEFHIGDEPSHIYEKANLMLKKLI